MCWFLEPEQIELSVYVAQSPLADPLGRKARASHSHAATVLASSFAVQPRKDACQAHSVPSSLLPHHISVYQRQDTCEAASAVKPRPCQPTHAFPGFTPMVPDTCPVSSPFQTPALWIHLGLTSNLAPPLASPSVSSRGLPLDFDQGSSFSLLPALIPSPPTFFLLRLFLLPSRPVSLQDRKLPGESPFQQTLVNEVQVRQDTHVTSAQAIVLAILNCVCECLSWLHSDVKVVSKYWSACWANSTPCLLSVFAADLASSCTFHSCSLISHMPANVLPPVCFLLSLEPSVLW